MSAPALDRDETNTHLMVESTVRVDRTTLLRALRLCKQAWLGSRPVPKLRNVRLQSRSGRLNVTSTDGEVEVQASMQGWPKGRDIDLYINRNGLSRDLSSMDIDAVKVGYVNRGDLWLTRLAGGTVTIERRPPDFYELGEAMPGPDRPSATVWTPDMVDRAVWVARAASRDDSRPVLTGVWFDDGWAVATDSYRLHASPVQSPTTSMLVPARVVELLAKHASNCDVRVAATDRIARLWWSKNDIDWQVTVEQITGTFPGWRKLIEPYVPAAPTFGTPHRLLVAAARRHVRIHQDQPHVHLNLSRHQQGGLCVTSYYDGTTVTEHVPDVPWPDGRTIAVRPRPLAETAGGFPEGQVHVEVTEPLKPIFLTDGISQALIMPMRTR